MENKMKEQITFDRSPSTSNIISLSKKKRSTLRNALMNLLNTNQYSTQIELATALEIQGFGKISQAKISRLLTNARAIKKYDKNKSVYQCPNEKQSPQSIDSVESLALNIAHNKTHIVLKTVKGGAAIVETMIGTMSKSHGILGCIASDTTILIIPCDTSKINDLIYAIKSHLKMDTLHVV
jgi:transcriptional regulator of arginine metabolism